MNVSSAIVVRLFTALGLMVAAGCVNERGRGDGGGVHPRGFADPESDDFHGRTLALDGYNLGRCKACHGTDYAGGPVDRSCLKCHEEGPEACGTCHGDLLSDPLPETGAHAVHQRFCEMCHQVPTQVGEPEHIDGDGVVEVRFEGLAVADGAEPVFDPDERTCSGVYCHRGRTMSWDGDSLDCSGCHEAPPDSHAPFARVVEEPVCGPCHVDPAGETHVNGTLDLVEDQPCTLCHGGEGVLGAPPPALDGAVDADDPQVGAHLRHLDGTLEDRIGATAECGDCHPVPEAMLSDGHLDADGQADVVLRDEGTYEAGQCTVSCHWDNDPGPTWTDTSGDARACGACHDMPPAETREGGRSHPEVESTPEACAECHQRPIEEHVNGEVDF